MPERNAPRQIVLASGNAGKLAELQALLAGFAVELIPQTALAVPEAEETGLTFIENALIKARHAAAHTGLPAIADDSGLAVDALGGAPGIYSARYAGPGATDADNNQRLLAELARHPEAPRSARFHCLLVFLRSADDPTPLIGEGCWEGEILMAPRGENGFGYDPLFLVPGEQCSSAELARERKNRISHRALAMQQFRQAWQQRYRSGGQR